MYNTSWCTDRVSKFNRQKIRNLQHLIDLVENCTDEWSIFEVRKQLVLPRVIWMQDAYSYRTLAQ
jgi:hypothetical protein